MRVGLGWDIHRLVEGRQLKLGGVNIPFDRGLHGHSDGDALVHAVIDALLGAACLGDIGSWFPPEDPAYKDADSLTMLAKVREELKRRNFQISNIDCVIICEKPKLKPHYETMRKTMSDCLAIDHDSLSVKATTAEGLGEIGEGSAIAAKAVALIYS